jgi:hypothetical protein
MDKAESDSSAFLFGVFINQLRNIIIFENMVLTKKHIPLPPLVKNFILPYGSFFLTFLL